MSYVNNDKIKVSILGGGINSAVGKAHLSALNLDYRFEVVSGFFSRNTELNELTANQCHIDRKRLYSSFEMLLEKEKDKIDALIILTPTNQHYKQVLAALRAGIPVICEKALTTNSKDASEIKKELEKYDGFLAVIYNYLGYPLLRELKHKIDSGVLGNINHIQIEMPQEGFLRKDNNDSPLVPQEWRLQDQLIPVISLDLGVHLHMIIKYLINETPVNVLGSSKNLGNFSGVIDHVSCMVNYTNKVTCNMWYSKVALGSRNGLTIRIFGGLGSAVWNQENSEILSLANNHGQRWNLDRGSSESVISSLPRYTRFKAGHPSGFIEALANYYSDIAASLVQYKSDRKSVLNSECFGLNESLEGLLFFEAISRSTSSNQWEIVCN